MRIFKDKVQLVDKSQHAECGIVLEDFSDVKPGDIIEAFRQEVSARV
jgi:translation initiation factor IF-2